MVFLITGGAGFIGSNFIDYMLRNHPCEVVCMDALTYAGCVDSLAAAFRNPRFQFVCADITNAEKVDAVFCRFHPDVVVNFAAESHVDRSIEQPALFVNTNMVGTANLLHAARRHGVRRFHQVSTDEVYGDLPVDSTLRFVEEDMLRPSSPYAASKAGADLLTLSFGRTYGLPVTVSRCTNNYGPHQFPEKLIPLCVVRALQDQTIPLYGDGSNVRDWMHVEDHCRAIDIILHRGIAGEVYNVGADATCNNRHMVHAILDILGKPATLIAQVSDRPGHDRRYALDSAKLRALGWEPTTPFAEGLTATVQWYVSHSQWWQDILSGVYVRRNDAYRE